MILSLAEKHVTLRKQGANYTGPCPKCGGSSTTTRFVVNVARDFCNCYSCGFNAGPVQFLREIEGKKCPEAHQILGIECENPHCPHFDKCSRGKGDAPREHRPKMAPPLLPAERGTGFETTPAGTPAEIWQQKAAKLVERAHLALLDNPEQLAYLAGRGLPLEAVQRYKLGYVPENFYRERSAWGLPPENWDNGKAKKLFIPQGIVIPWILSGQIHRIRIRKQSLRDDKDARYYWLPGSGNDIICLNPTAPAHVIVESDLDGLLIDWSAGDLVGTVPLGSCSTHPKATALAALEKSLRILVALDFDTPKWDDDKKQWLAPGAKASQWWQKTFPRSYKRWPAPQGKDPGEAFAAGVDLRAWVVAGLPPAQQIRATAPEPAPSAAPAVTSPAAEVPQHDLIRTETDRKGRPYLITNSPEIYRQKRDAGEVIFSIKELEMAMQVINSAGELGEKLADFIMHTKHVLRGCYIKEVTLY